MPKAGVKSRFTGEVTGMGPQCWHQAHSADLEAQVEAPSPSSPTLLPHVKACRRIEEVIEVFPPTHNVPS